jgi:Tol biopolymer transport system component/tRNA A-37 threonylcarbamoyl transferase component Bud32
MSLTPGEKLGPYEIVSPIGEGGMGAVWKARDTRLNRIVAIKQSHKQFNERFEREAHAIAALNHPNICQLYDIGPDYLVMEYIEGAPLKGPLPLDQVLSLAGQMLNALSAAHQKGITHRDLKPANILVTKSGAKLLDFGLAKTSHAPGPEDATVTAALTNDGTILGTLQYMSPEQLEGKEADARSDIFAFGLVLYEMIAGKRAFPGSTHASLIASILKEKAPPLAGPLDRVVQTCLEKDPDKRWQSAREVKHALEWISHETPAPTAPARRQWLWPTAAALAVAMAAVGWNWYRATRLTDLPLVRQDVDLGSDIALNPPVIYVSNVVISPDGTRLAYVASAASGGQVKLFTRRLDQPKAVDLAGTEGARGPFFSPDGRWLGFASGRKLSKISVDGGAVVPLMDLSANFGGASWGEDSIVVAQVGTPLVRIPSGGGPATPVMEFTSGENTQASPQLLPGGKAALFASNILGGADNATVDVASLADRRRKTLAHGAFPRYAPSSNGTGHLLYTFRGALYAIPFDPEKLETRGAAVPVLDDVMGTAEVAAKFDVSRTGTLVYQKGAGGGGPQMSTVQWLDSAGKLEPLLPKPGVYSSPRLSPDGKRLAFSIVDGVNQDIQVYEWQNDRTTKLTFGGIYDNPIWSPDNQYVVFRSRILNGRMFWSRADGAGQPQPLAERRIPWSFSPDGKRLAFVEQDTNLQIWTTPVEDQSGQLKAGTPEQFLKTQFDNIQPAFSPDGRWLAYRSTEGTAPEVYVRPFPPPASGSSGQWVISAGGGQNPVWSRTSHDLFYRGPDGLMAVSYTVKGDTFVADKPRLWSAKLATSNFDLAPDGKRLAVVMPVQGAEAPKPEHEIVFLENFFDELRRRVPVGK